MVEEGLREAGGGEATPSSDANCANGVGVWSRGFGVWGFGLRLYGLGCGVWRVWLEVSALGPGFTVLGLRVED